jgi:hypothetical protein
MTGEEAGSFEAAYEMAGGFSGLITKIRVQDTLFLRFVLSS